jgi:hypothetical protein
MVEIVERVARRDWFIEDQQGNRQDVHAGKSYTTTRNVKDGKVVLFSSFWVPVPLDVFQESVCSHCGSPVNGGCSDGSR